MTHGDLTAIMAAAARLRAALFGPFGAERDTNAYRLINGEGDGAPGIAVDAYAGYLVVQVAREEAQPLAVRLEEAIAGAVRPRGIVRKLRYRETGRGKVAAAVTHGEPPPAPLTVSEDGIPFGVDILEGLHTGLFTDMREERARLRRLARGLRVLNTFAYTGAFSVAAAAGGAAEVTSVDVVPKALERARSNFRLAGLDPEAHRFARMDVLEFLRMAARRGLTFDAVVLDPPTFARFKGGAWSLRSAYGELVRRALAVLAPGGLLWAAANTESMPVDRFEKSIAGAFAAAGRAGSLLAVGGLPPDHPTPIGAPRARYLKVHVIRAS
jgi:23S rRNA (cytosine1962-C5)-methyltransferase